MHYNVRDERSTIKVAKALKEAVMRAKTAECCLSNFHAKNLRHTVISVQQKTHSACIRFRDFHKENYIDATAHKVAIVNIRIMMPDLSLMTCRETFLLLVFPKLRRSALKSDVYVVYRCHRVFLRAARFVYSTSNWSF